MTKTTIRVSRDNATKHQIVRPLYAWLG